jgi:hypothetical protein
MVAVAELEAGMISARTRAALVSGMNQPIEYCTTSRTTISQ